MNEERAANAVDRKLGQRVRSRRLEIGMSQERLARLLGVSFQQVQKYEKGVNRIAASRLFDIAAALDLPVTRFFDDIAPPRGEGALDGDATRDLAEAAMSTPEGAELLALFASIESRKLRRRVVELVRALAEDAAAGERE